MALRRVPPIGDEGLSAEGGGDLRLRTGFLLGALAVVGCGGDDEGAGLTPCEQAWEDGLGNAGQPGIDRDEWIEDCRHEGGDETLDG